jgi:deoxyribodipyrimidine photolyase-like uncharacterized protein
MRTIGKRVFLLFGNQLFDPHHLRDHRDALIVMVEDDSFCRRHAYHRQKLTFILAAMRSHADALRATPTGTRPSTRRAGTTAVTPSATSR